MSLVVSVPVAIVRDSSVNGWLQMIAGCEMREAIVGAVCDFGGTLDEDVLLKWPNDILLAARNLVAYSLKWCRFRIAGIALPL